MSSVSPSVSTPSSNPDLVINPIYSRFFAKDFAQELARLNVQKVKHAYLLDVHDALVRENLAFPGLNPRTLEKALLLAYETLSGFDVRVGKKNAYEAARHVLEGRSPFLRKPLYVYREDVINESVLQGEGLDDNHWCVTQWVPWMLQDGQAVMDEIMGLIGGEDGEDPPYVKLSRDDLLLAARQVKCMFTDYHSLVDLIGDCTGGHDILLTHSEFLNRVYSFVALHNKSVLARIATVVPAGAMIAKPDTESMQNPSEDETLGIIANTKIKIKLVHLDLDDLEQYPFAMKKDPLEAHETFQNSNVRISLAVEDSDSPAMRKHSFEEIYETLRESDSGSALGLHSAEDPDSDFEITADKKDLVENSQGELEQDFGRHSLLFGTTRDGMAGTVTNTVTQPQSPFAMQKESEGEVAEVLRNSKIKITLIPENSDDSQDQSDQANSGPGFNV